MLTDSDTPTDTATTSPAPDGDLDGFAADVDCDDADPDVYPGAPDRCGDDVVKDCDRDADDGLVTVDGEATFEDLQTALDAAMDGSEILVCPGTYVGNFLASVPVRLVAYGLPDAVQLRGQGATTLSVPGGSEVVGFTIRGGNFSGNGGGLRMTTSGTLLVDSCVITDNSAKHGGGLYVAADSTATLVSTTVSDNFAAFGGGGAAVEANGTLDLSQGSAVINNFATLFGGGIWLDGAHLVGGEVSGNVADAYASASTSSGVLDLDGAVLGGGGVAMSGTSDITGAEILMNVGTGAGVSVTEGDGTLIDTLVTDNDATNYYGGGATVWLGSLTLTGTSAIDSNTAYLGGGVTLIDGTLSGGTVSNNEAISWGGGVVAAFGAAITDVLVSANNVGYSGGGIFVIGSASLTRLSVDGNLAGESGGGFATLEGYYLSYGDNSTTIEDSSFTANDAEDGGGLYSAFPLTLLNTTISDNTAARGAGLYVVDRTTSATAGAFLRNVASVGGGGVLVGAGASFSADNTDFGSAADDNTPNDVRAGAFEYVGYEATETFSCSQVGCAPPP